jgi:ribonuclease VapC
MIIDTSAIIAILREEPEATFCARAIADASNRSVSAVNYVEAAVVIDASGDPIASRRVHAMPIEILAKAAGIRRR